MTKSKRKLKKALNGRKVALHYKGTLEDGTVFDDSRARGEEMNITLGKGQLIPGFEKAVVGMKSGETKTFKVESADAYGDPNPTAVIKVPKASFPEDFVFQEGRPVMGSTQDGKPVRAVLTEQSESEVTLDCNHPLAGQDLTFEVELVEVTADSDD